MDEGRRLLAGFGGVVGGFLEDGCPVVDDGDDVCVAAPDGDGAGVRLGGDRGFQEDGRVDAGESHFDLPLVHQGLGGGVVGLGDVGQSFQALLPVPGHHAQGGREDVADGVGVGDAAGKGIFIQAGVHGYGHGLDGTLRQAPGAGGGEGDGPRFRHPQGGDHVVVDEFGQWVHGQCPPWLVLGSVVFQNGPELLEQLVPAAALGLALAVGIVIVDDLLVRCAVFRSGCITYPNP